MAYISTACLKGDNGHFEKDFYKALAAYANAGIHDIELGSCHSYFSSLARLSTMQKEFELNFIMHCFFPPLKEQLWVNIASQDPKVLKASLNVAASAIDLCRKLNAPLYTIHPGYTVELKPKDMPEAATEPAAYEKAFATFADSAQTLADQAQQNGIRLGVETQYNDLGYMLLSRADEFTRLFSMVKNKNLGVLFDFGHSYGNAKLFGFDVKEFIAAIRDRIIAFHIHDGKGADRHAKIGSLEFFKDFERGDFKNRFLTLEATGLEMQEILQQKELLDRLG